MLIINAVEEIGEKSDGGGTTNTRAHTDTYENFPEGDGTGRMLSMQKGGL